MTGSAAETRMQLNRTIEWTGEPWLKDPIDKGCSHGQITHGKGLTAALKWELEKYAAALEPRGKGRVKGERRARVVGRGPNQVPQILRQHRRQQEEKQLRRKRSERTLLGVFFCH